ncbi:MAG TPA: 30S ribosomal protein S7 [Lentisphaeria bacterium]|nr:30S ribosomal protein S7 [Lentisphaeria bacterium]
MRRHKAEKRELTPDVKYNSEMVSMTINIVMRGGKKSTAQKIVYGALDIIKEKKGLDPLEVFLQALENTKPRLEVKSRRVGGATYQVPVEVSPARQTALSIRWVVDAARGRKGRAMLSALAAELMDAYDETGSVIKKKDDTHRMAQANKAFAHYRW